MRKTVFNAKLVLRYLIVVLLGLFSNLFLRGEGEVIGRNGMVVSVDRYASEVGVEILKKGGNAVDAAVAVGFALAVTYPSAGNLGGGGFMVIRFPDTGKAVSLDFREKAPEKASPGMYLDDEGNYVEKRSLEGHLAVGIPGTVKGLELAAEKYGKLSWKDVLRPAIYLAEHGFKLTERKAKSFNKIKKDLPWASEFLRVFSKPDRSEFKEGDVFVQKDLAASLCLIAEQGSSAFYTGKIAELIVLDMKKHGGLITEEDLAKYKAVIRDPVRGGYRGCEIISMPPPSSGGTTLIEMLNILEGFDLGRKPRFAFQTLHLIAETMKFAYLDRAKELGDSDFGNIPVSKLISKDHAQSMRDKLNLEKAVPSAVMGQGILSLSETLETTHYSVIDKDGLAVATTYTLNGSYGSGVMAEGTGFLLNNEMADFNMKPGYTDDKGLIGTQPNLIQPYKRMLSSMTPTIIVKDGKPFLITGSPGGRTIINTVLGVILNIIDFKMGVQEALDAGRMDHEWMPDVLHLEEGSVSEETRKALEAMGHKIKLIEKQGDAHSIWIDPSTGFYHGAADGRSEGLAVGY